MPFTHTKYSYQIQALILYLYIGHETRGSVPKNSSLQHSGRSFSSEDIKEAAEFLSLPIYRQQQIVNIDQDEENDAIESFGTTSLLDEWRTKLLSYSAMYTDWSKKSKSLFTKVINMKISMQKEMIKVGHSIGNEVRQLNSELQNIPCSVQQASEFSTIFHAVIWITDLLEVCTKT